MMKFGYADRKDDADSSRLTNTLHWTSYDSEGPFAHPITFNINAKMFHWMEQNRGDKARSKFVRDILIKIMEPISKEDESID